MKKKLLFSISSLILGVSGVNAVNLCTPVITSQTVEDGKVTIEWSYDNSVDDATHFQVTVYKMHKATQEEKFVLAKSDFDYIYASDEYTMNHHEYRGTQWAQVEENPGWWVKSPTFMNKSIGTDTFMNYAGSDNDDIFSGSYMISPDYDLSNVTDKTFYINAHIAKEADSVQGGWAIWTWNTNWWDPSNVDYRPVYGLDHLFGLSSSSWKEVSEACTLPNAEDYTDQEILDEINGMDLTRARVHFYGRGYSTYWIDDFEVSVNLQPGDMVDYGASENRVEGNSFVIDTTGDTDTDYVYAYEVRAVKEMYDDGRDLMTIRATNYPYTNPKNKIYGESGVNNIAVDKSDVRITAANGEVTVAGAATARVYTMTGTCVYDGSADSPIAVGHGMFVVKAGDKKAKVVL